MRNPKVRELLTLSTSSPRMVGVDTTLRDVAEKMVEDRATREVYLVDEDERFLGVITLRRLARSVFSQDVPKSSPTEMLDWVSARIAGDLALKKSVYVHEDNTLDDVLDIMFRFDLNEVPVVDSERVVVGSLGMLELVASWQQGRFDGVDS